MEKIQITFLGTSSAVPTITRNHTAILFKYKNENILFDCGEGTQRQFRKAKINPCKLTRLVLTHLHGDHVFGIPGLFQTLNLNEYKKTLQIYGPKPTEKFIKDLFTTFVLTKTIQIKTKVTEVTNKVFETPDFKITALPLQHGTPTLGYVFQEKDKLRINKKKLAKLKIPSKFKSELAKLSKGKDIKINNKKIKYKQLTYPEKGRKIAIILDTGLCPNIKKLAKNTDLAIIEATTSEKTGYKHLTAEEAARAAKQSNVKKLILTHLSQRYEFKADLLEKQAKKIFSNSKVAKDFMKIEI